MLSTRKMILSMSPKNQRLWFYHAQNYFFYSSIILHILTLPLCIHTNYCFFFFLSKGGAIQGSTKTIDAAHFASIITEGDYYEVKNFYTFENRYMNTVISHEAVIDLKSDTKVTRLDSLPLLFHDITLISLISHMSLTKEKNHDFSRVFFIVTLP